MPCPPLTSVARATVSIITMSLTVGTVLGYQALQKVLLAEHAYGCTPDDVSCAPAHAQFLCALTLLNLVTVPATWAAQRRPTATASVGGVVISVGYVLMMLANVGCGSSLYFIGYLVIGVGGSCMGFGFLSYLTTFPGFESAPWSTVINNIMPAAFDLSAMLFQVWQWLYDHQGVSFVALCIGSAVLPLLLALLMPWVFAESRPLVTRSEEDEGLVTCGEGEEHMDPASECESRAGGENEQLLEPLVLLFCGWAVMMMTSKYWWYDNVQQFMRWRLGSDDDARRLYDGFNIALPLASAAMVITTPLLSWSLPGAIVVMGVLSATVGALTSCDSFALQAVNVGIVLFNRYFFFATSTVACIRLFGPRKGARVISLMMVCGSTATLIGVGLDALVRRNRSLYWINLPLNGVAGLVCVVTAGAVQSRLRGSGPLDIQISSSGASVVPAPSPATTYNGPSARLTDT